jgi:hypothetical protein
VAGHHQNAVLFFGRLQHVVDADDVDALHVTSFRHPNQRKIFANRPEEVGVERLDQPADIGVAWTIPEHLTHVVDDRPFSNREQVVEQHPGERRFQGGRVEGRRLRRDRLHHDVFSLFPSHRAIAIPQAKLAV